MTFSEFSFDDAEQSWRTIAEETVRYGMKHINKEIGSNYVARHEARVDSRAVVVDAESASVNSQFQSNPTFSRHGRP